MSFNVYKKKISLEKIEKIKPLIMNEITKMVDEALDEVQLENNDGNDEPSKRVENENVNTSKESAKEA